MSTCRPVAALVTLLAWASAAAASDVPRPAWRHEIPAWGEPAVAGSHAYVLARTHHLVAIDTRGGVLRWATRTGGTGAIPWGAAVRVTASHVVVGDGGIAAFDRETGRPAWRFTPASRQHVGPFLGDADDEIVLVGSSTGRLFALDTRSGALRWSRRVARGRDTTVLPPRHVGGRIVAAATTFDGALHGTVVAFDRRGRLRWRRSLSGAGAAAGPLPYEQAVLVPATDGRIVAHALADGRLQASFPPAQPEGGARRDVRALAVSGRTLVAGSLDGDIVGYDLDERRERWRYRGGADGAALRLRAAGSIVLAPFTSGALVALGLDTGEERWRLGNAASRIDWPPAVTADGFVAAGAEAIAAWSWPDSEH